MSWILKLHSLVAAVIESFDDGEAMIGKNSNFGIVSDDYS